MATGTRAKNPRPPTPEQEEAKLQRDRRARMNLDPMDAPRLYIEMFYPGTVLDTLDDFVRFLIKNPLNDSIAKVGGVVAFANGLAMCMKGDVRAIELMMKYATGVPDRGYAGFVNELDATALIEEIDAIGKEIDAPANFTERLLDNSRRKMKS